MLADLRDANLLDADLGGMKSTPHPTANLQFSISSHSFLKRKTKKNPSCPDL
jgi:hypothetical protein